MEYRAVVTESVKDIEREIWNTEGQLMLLGGLKEDKVLHRTIRYVRFCRRLVFLLEKRGAFKDIEEIMKDVYGKEDINDYDFDT